MSFGLKQSNGGKEGYYLGGRKKDVGDEDEKEWSGCLFGQKEGPDDNKPEMAGFGIISKFGLKCRGSMLSDCEVSFRNFTLSNL